MPCGYPIQREFVFYDKIQQIFILIFMQSKSLLPVEPGKHLFFYDGVCKFCDGLVQYLLSHDKQDKFRLVALQSELGQMELDKSGKNAKGLNTLYVITDYNTSKAKIYDQANAVIKIMEVVGGFWKIAIIGKLAPNLIRNFFYQIFAKNRYWIFGKYNVCKIPSAEQIRKFIAYE
jgi:predicted DCC family thiol-disulfide oxidoreductase YuxK